MAEQLHESLHRHAGVHERSRIGVAELVGNDLEWCAVGAGESCVADGVSEPALHAGGAEVPPVFDEHEVGRPMCSRVWPGALSLSVSEPFIEGFEGVTVEWDDSFGVELADRDAQPTPGGPVVDDRVEFEFQ